MGPALFAIALQPVVERLREVDLEVHLWYLDDGVLVGTIEAIKMALKLLKELLPVRGLELNVSKCKLFGPAASNPDLDFEGIPRYSLGEGTVVLGVPIGSDDAFVDSYVNEVCAKLSLMAMRIGLLRSNIAKFLLLRACFGACRVNHLRRSLPFRHARSLAEKSSVCAIPWKAFWVRLCLTSAFCWHVYQCAKAGWESATLRWCWAPPLSRLMCIRSTRNRFFPSSALPYT